jgi:hypothetical protein
MNVFLVDIVAALVLPCSSDKGGPGYRLGRSIRKFLVSIFVIIPVLSRGQLVEEDSIYHVLPKDAIPAIMSPSRLTLADAQEIMVPGEQIIGVVGPRGTAVAYSTWYLDRHEIVNDVIDGVALAVTW